MNRLFSRCAKSWPVHFLCLLGFLFVLLGVTKAHAAGYTPSITTAYPQLTISNTAPMVPWYGGNCGNTLATASPYVACDDGLSPVLPIGFSFSFAGTAYTTWSMSSNGVIFFETGAAGTGSTGGNSYTPSNLPTATFSGKPALMPFWADLFKNASATGVLDITSASQPASASFIQYQTVTVSGVQVLVIQLKKVGYYGATGTLVNMQIQLWATGQVVYSYGSMAVLATNPALRIGLQYPGGGCNTLANNQSASLSNQSYVYVWDIAANTCPVLPTVNHYEIRHDGAATLCAEPISVLACSGAAPCAPANIITTQIINASVTATAAGAGTPTITPVSFTLQPSTPIEPVNLTWPAGSAGTSTLGIQAALAPNTLACANVAGTATSACTIAVSNTTCIPPPHHYEIQGPATGRTCTKENFTIKAWADAAQTTAYTAAAAVGTLTATGNAVSIPNLGAFSIAAGASTVNISPITFPATGSTTFNVTATPALAGATTCNFGGSTSCTLPVAACSPDVLYRFDEGSWTGAANEVRDSSGNARHASLYKRNSLGGVVATYPTKIFPPNGKKCSAAYFAPQATTGVNSTVKTPIVPGDQGTVHFWYKSDQAWSGTGAKSATLFDATTSTAANAVMPFYLGKSAGGGLYFYTVDSSSTQKAISGWLPGFVGFSYAAGVWHHIAATWDLRAGQNALAIYVDGVQTTSTGIVASGSSGIFTPWKSGDTLSIGDARAPDIDVTAVGAPGLSVDSANGAIDEFYYYPYAISLAQIIADRDSATPTCTPGLHHVQIEHADGAGITCSPSTVTLKACADATCSTLYTGGDVTGTMTSSGGAANWVGGTSFSIGVSGTATKDVQVTTTTAATLGATVTTPTGTTNSTTCLFGAATDCKFTSVDAGFIFDVPNHVADLSQSVNISAVKKSDSSLACAPAFASVSKTVNFNCSYTNPSTGTKPVIVGGTNVSCGTASGVSLAFDATGKAATTVRYADVGQMSLTANFTGTTGSTDAGLVMNGSDTFIAAPKSFSVAVSGSPYIAGSPFNARVTALNNSGTVTPNFGLETPAEGATLSFSRCQPTGVGTVDGSFAGSLGAFSGGAAIANNLIWSEVGNGDVVATLTASSYLGSSVAVATGNTSSNGTVCNGGAGAVGPFRPGYFDTVVTPGCSAAFTYAGLTGKLAGQPFTVKVKAKRTGGDSSDGTNTVNYAGATWAKAVTLSDAAAVPVGTLTNTAIPATAFVSGIATVSTPTYTFAAKRAPYSLAIRAVDTDTVTSSGHAEGVTDVRSGRLRLSNAYGSVSPIYMPVEAQYWSGLSWVKNIGDSCTTTTGGTPQVTFAVAPASTGWILTPAAFATGQMGSILPSGPTGIRIVKPPPGATTITATVPDWLKWTWGGVATPVAPSANANVGIYGTPESRRSVHVRELY
ncbi:LamG domain-containing protein [Dechloromonas sp. HYN0024]|uniref:LamG domain-containing protein n=1 Tax=Dechloromonas sp. HYN0024 TaxID=2231055 RepID=UPI000E43B66B|nr:LamG domain-containing protein [Dechloromonas sp. HYN0024]AXS79719.1 LamG domain-containing protein [Dechloromonas sp. HYN0024]